jgi:hypothetical protein
VDEIMCGACGLASSEGIILECPCVSCSGEGPRCMGCCSFHVCTYCGVNFCSTGYGRHDTGVCRADKSGPANSVSFVNVVAPLTSLGPEPVVHAPALHSTSALDDPDAWDPADVHEEEPFEYAAFDDLPADESQVDAAAAIATLADHKRREAKRSADNLTRATNVIKRHRYDTDAIWADHLARSNRAEGPRLPMLAAPGAGTAAAYAKIHSTHTLMRLKCLVFCRVCGYWMQERPQRLVGVCGGAPLKSDGRSRLKRLLSGLHPERKVLCWPDGSDASGAVAPEFL